MTQDNQLGIPAAGEIAPGRCPYGNDDCPKCVSPTPPNEDMELREALDRIMRAPMRSEISTSDIAVGMWSSTALSEKIHDLMHLITAHTARREVEARESTAKIYEREIKMLRAFQESVVRREQLKVNKYILEVPGPGLAKYIEFSTAEDAEKAMSLVSALKSQPDATLRIQQKGGRDENT